MPKVFVAPGHGRKPDGTFDPGAVGHAGTKQFIEHDLNTKVANALAAALERCGVQVALEQGGGNHDPNFIGSTAAANAAGADYAIEIHHNAAGGSGSEVLVNDHTSAANRQLAESMAAELASALGIHNRGVIARSREFFNREANMPSCIPECAFVDSSTDQAVIDQPGYAATAAEAICKPLCGFLGVAFRPSDQTVPTGEEELSMSDASEIMAFLKQMKQDMAVRGTTGLQDTVEDFATRQRETLGKLDEVDRRLAAIEQHLGIHP